MKILITDTVPLYPPMWGGPKRIWGLYSNFSKDLFDIVYVGVSFDINNSGLRYKFNKINDNFREILCKPTPNYYLWHIFEKIFFRNTSLDLFVYLWMHTDWQFKYMLNSQNADIVICSHPWSSLCIKKKEQFFIYDAHNCEYLLMDKILRKHILKRLVLRQVKKIEGDACRKSDLILACSENEKKDLVDLYKINPDKITIINNGASVVKKTDQIKKAECRRRINIALDEKVIIFVGAYYKPNIDAVRFIIDKVAMELKEFKFLIAGTVSDAFKTEQICSNIKLLGRLSEENLDTALRASDIAINPMFSGSGINIKMLDYFSYGLPVVTTQVGARGIETNEKNVMMISSKENFSDNIKMLSTNKVLYEQMATSARDLIAERYDWKLISSKLQDIILERLNKQ